MKNTTHMMFHSVFALLTSALLTATARADLSDGQWLIDYGRAHGAAVTNPQPADAEFILVWLDAATELSPELAEAYRWRFDLLSRLNRNDDAIKNLKQYCEKNPQDAPALLTIFNTELDNLQKIEERIDLCNAYLARPQIPADAASEIQLHIATLQDGQGDHDAALAHARRAIDIAPYNLSAHLFLAKLENRVANPETQVDLMLKAIAVDPGSMQLRWQLGTYLKQRGMYEEATTWLNRAASIWVNQTGAQPPAPIQTEIAEIHLKKGEFAKAIALAQEVISAEPQYAPASFVIIRAARKLSRSELAESESSKLTNRFRDWETNPRLADAATCFTIAQYFLDVQPDAQRAVRYAKLATEKEPANPSARTLLARGYVAAGLNAEANKIFSTVPDIDAQSALAWANAQKALGDQSSAVKTLETAAKQPSEFHDEINRALEELNVAASPPVDLSAAKKRLSSFDEYPLVFANDPTQFINFEVQLSNHIIKFGEPLSATITLQNKGNKPIVLGSNRMLNPQVAVSLLTDLRIDAPLDNYLTIDIPGGANLKPGETRSVEQSLMQSGGDVFLKSQPQRRSDMHARFILDPVVNENGLVVSRYPVIQPTDAPFMRTPIDATEEGLAKLRKQLVSTNESERLLATESFVGLILERRESMKRKPQTYLAQPVDPNEVAKDTLTTLSDPSPFVRARSLAVLTRLPINPDTIKAATPLISDPHWLVRLLAVEYFAKKQGPVFYPVLEKLAEDPHPIVARLATLYRDQARAIIQSRRIRR